MFKLIHIFPSCLLSNSRSSQIKLSRVSQPGDLHCLSHQLFPVPARKVRVITRIRGVPKQKGLFYKTSMTVLRYPEALQNIEETVRENFPESTNLGLSKQMLILELREVEQERDDWKTKCERYEQERDAWKIKYEQQLINVQNLESFQKAVEIQVLTFKAKV